MDGFAAGIPLPFGGRGPDQICWTARDLDEAVARIGRALAISRWRVWTYSGDELRHRSYRGVDAEFSSLTAMSAFGPSVEIVQPISGPSVFTDFLDKGHDGIHHLGWFVESAEDHQAWFADRGIPEIMRGGGHGLDGDGLFVFYDTLELLGTYVELVEPVARRREPLRVIDIAEGHP